MSYKYDIFISHSAGNKQNDELLQWVKQLRFFFNIIIEKLFDIKPDILISDDLNKNIEFKDINREKIYSNTAIHLFVLTPDFIDSVESTNEVNQIFNVIYKYRNKETQSIFKILKKPIANKNQPTLLQKYFEYQFYNIDLDEFNNQQINELQGHENEDLFWFKLVDLSYEIYKKLIEIQDDKYAQLFFF